MRKRGSMAAAWVPAIAVVALLTCCSRGDARRDSEVAPPSTGAGREFEHRQDSPAESRPRIVLLGDSLTAGLGLPPGEAYPAILQREIDALGANYEVVNAGVSGDTSAGGLSRLDWVLTGDVRILVVALGGNDGLRGLPATGLSQNLEKIIEKAQGRGIKVILAGMEAPPNYGATYALSFHQVYPTLAERHHVPLVPFLLQGVAGDQALNQPDGIHPTAEGARIVANNVWAVLRPMLQEQDRSHD
jgi:acyl-CoA thioesterase I